MSNVDVIRQGVAQQNNYNGAKIVVHNPTVNVPPLTGYAKPDYPIYEYPSGKIPANYYQEQLAVTTPKAKPVQIPEGKAVVEEPASVLLPVKNVPVPPPVYDEKNSQPEEAVAVTSVPQEQEVTSASTLVEEPVSVVTTPVEVVKPAETAPVKAIETPIIEDVATEPVVVKKPMEIVPPVTPELEVDYIKVCANLESPDYDVQALQLKDIVDAAANSVKTKDLSLIKPYHVEQIFIDIIDIVNKDTTSLAGPTEAQLQIRDKIIENYISSMNQVEQGVAEKDVVLPNQLTQEDINYANMLSARELAERNRDYAIATLAVVSKTFIDRVESETNTKVPITDVPGLADIVNTLKNPHYATRLTALDALNFLQKPEYLRELTPIYEALMQTDPDENVRSAAALVLDNLNKQLPQEQVPQQVA